MKKILLIATFLLFAIVPAFADTMVVGAMTDIHTKCPNAVVRVKVLRDCFLDGVSLRIGYVLEGKIYVKEPKRLKRNASFTFSPISYTDLEGNTTKFTDEYSGKFTEEFQLDVKSLAESAITSVANHFIKGISFGYYAVKGAVENKDGNRFVSCADAIYQHSPLSYIEKGYDLEILKESVFGLKFAECENCPMSEE